MVMVVVAWYHPPTMHGEGYTCLTPRSSHVWRAASTLLMAPWHLSVPGLSPTLLLWSLEIIRTHPSRAAAVVNLEVKGPPVDPPKCIAYSMLVAANSISLGSQNVALTARPCGPRHGLHGGPTG